MASEIAGDIENYRSLLHILQDNGDMDLYNKGLKEFNAYNAKFKMVGRESE
jgi:hypothetical protein